MDQKTVSNSDTQIEWQAPKLRRLGTLRDVAGNVAAPTQGSSRGGAVNS